MLRIKVHQNVTSVEVEKKQYSATYKRIQRMNPQQQGGFFLPVSGFTQEQTFCGTEPTQMPSMNPQNTYPNIPPPCGPRVQYQPQWPSFQDQNQAACPPMQDNIVYG